MSEELTMQTVVSADSSKLEELASTEVNSAKAQMKMFIIAQAKSQLQKVLDLNEKLDKWTDTYTKRAEEEMANNPNISPEQISVYMTQIMGMIDRSFAMIKEVASDEKLLNLMYLDLSQNVTNNNNVSGTSSNTAIIDSKSRAKIRETVTAVLEYVNNGGDIGTNNVVDIEPENITE